mmetsp:Transcript_42168/g.55553  ORF Transcript_42168/g.55553 Transcript_42168/m.55553 type:complete len:145 (-) Transcript_42168:178-612(-)
MNISLTLDLSVTNLAEGQALNENHSLLTLFKLLNERHHVLSEVKDVGLWEYSICEAELLMKDKRRAYLPWDSIKLADEPLCETLQFSAVLHHSQHVEGSARERLVLAQRVMPRVFAEVSDELRLRWVHLHAKVALDQEQFEKAI